MARDRVYTIRMILEDEDGGLLGKKTGIIHKIDIPAGKYHCETKLKEILIDLDCAINGS